MYECCSCEAYINKWSKPYWFNLLDVILPTQRKIKRARQCSISPWAPLWNHLLVQLLFPWRTKFLLNRIICLRLDGWERCDLQKNQHLGFLERSVCKEIIGCSWCSVDVGVFYCDFLPWSARPLTWMCTVSVEGNVWNDLSTERTVISAKCLAHLWAQDIKKKNKQQQQRENKEQ